MCVCVCVCLCCMKCNTKVYVCVLYTGISLYPARREIESIVRANINVVLYERVAYVEGHRITGGDIWRFSTPQGASRYARQCTYKKKGNKLNSYQKYSMDEL